jgi:hypothetical protein
MPKNNIHVVFRLAKRKCDFRFAPFFNRLPRLKNAGPSVDRAQAVAKRRFATAC